MRLIAALAGVAAIGAAASASLPTLTGADAVNARAVIAIAKAMQAGASQDDLRAAVVAACGVQVDSGILAAELGGTDKASAATGTLSAACGQFRQAGLLPDSSADGGSTGQSKTGG